MSEPLRVLFIGARLEDDETFTLLIHEADTEPIELGKGFLSIGDCKKAIVATLTEPAIGNDLKEQVDDLAPKVQELLDIQAVTDQNIEAILAKVAELEERIKNPENPRPAPPRATRQPVSLPAQERTSPTSLRRPAIQVPRESPDDPGSSRRRGSAGNWEETNAEIIEPAGKGHKVYPSPGHPVAAPPADKNAHQYEGSRPESGFIPHIPMGGVTRGPGSKG